MNSVDLAAQFKELVKMYESLVVHSKIDKSEQLEQMFVKLATLIGEKYAIMMSRDDYIRAAGGKSYSPNSALHHNKGNCPDKQWSKMARDEFRKAMASTRNDWELGEEYDAKVQSGELRPLTRIEHLTWKAHGHEDLQSTQAARSLLAKKGINWEL